MIKSIDWRFTDKEKTKAEFFGFYNGRRRQIGHARAEKLSWVLNLSGGYGPLKFEGYTLGVIRDQLVKYFEAEG